MNNQKRWSVHPPLTLEAEAELAGFPRVLQQLLFNRGYARRAEAEAFLNAEPGFDADPFRLLGMKTAIARICRALDQAEPIAIYGDYDVDGVTATALLVQALRAFGANVEGYIPNRFDEGYGLNMEALDHLKAKGVRLVITVDCGIRSPAEAAHARQIGLDLIISDHHHPAAGELPPALAVINPKQDGDEYPDRNLAGVGLAYKMAEALFACQPPQQSLQLEELLDLVALGTVADLAPLTGENRALVRRGLDRLRAGSRQGVRSLAGAAEMQLARINAGHIGFVLGPRLNAAGRLESALAAFDLLTTDDVQAAGLLAQQLNNQNRRRQDLTRQMQEQAEVLATAEDKEPWLLIAVHEQFNPGVVGLAASRLTDKYYRPAIVAFKGETETRGSCRSIPEFHITDALDECADLLVRHGGHAAAAGFTVRNENLPALIGRMQGIAERQLRDCDLRRVLMADAELPIAEIDFKLVDMLREFEPTGYGNPEPVFVSRDVTVRTKRTVGEGKHLKLSVSGKNGSTLDCIGFRLGDLWETLPGKVDLMYVVEVNEYRGQASLQLNLKDVRPAGLPDDPAGRGASIPPIQA